MHDQDAVEAFLKARAEGMCAAAAGRAAGICEASAYWWARGSCRTGGAVGGCGRFFGPATPPVPNSCGTASDSSNPVSPSVAPHCSISGMRRACGKTRGSKRPTSHGDGKTHS